MIVVYVMRFPWEIKEKPRRDFVSVGAQVAVTAEYIRWRPELRGQRVEILREEGEQAKALYQRPKGRILRERIDSGQVTDIVVARLDRIFRHQLDGLRCLYEYEQRGIRLHLADQTGNALSTGNALGRMVISQVLHLRAYESGLAAERTEPANKRHIREDPSAYVGGLEYGYRRTDKEGRSCGATCGRGRHFGHGALVRIVDVPAEQEVIARVMALVAAGWRVTQIVDQLNRDRVPSKRGASGRKRP